MRIALIVAVKHDHYVTTPAETSYQTEPSREPYSVYSDEEATLLAVVPGDTDAPGITVGLGKIPITFDTVAAPVGIGKVITEVAVDLQGRLGYRVGDDGVTEETGNV